MWVGDCGEGSVRVGVELEIGMDKVISLGLRLYKKLEQMG